MKRGEMSARVLRRRFWYLLVTVGDLAALAVPLAAGRGAATVAMDAGWRGLERGGGVGGG